MRSDMSSEAGELVLFADNDGDLYRQSFQPILQNLRKKVKKGTYSPTLAVKLWLYHAERAAKAYEREFLRKGEWSKIFPPKVRREAAEHWESQARRNSLDDEGLGIASHSQARSRSRMRKRPAKRLSRSRSRR